MEQYIIKGGNPLVGEVEIGGAKNAALAIISPTNGLPPLMTYCSIPHLYEPFHTNT